MPETSFEFVTAGRVIFGAGRLREVGPIAAGLGRRALVVTGARIERAAPLFDLLTAHGVATTHLGVAGEPSTQLVREGTQVAHRQGCDMVVGLGGGSVLDAGKAIAALLANEGDLLDYLEVIGQGRPLVCPSVPYIAIPTTAGTGAEVTRNAVLASPEHAMKVSLRSPLMLPRVALVDPELTHSLPREVTASTGLDALTQLIEPYVSNRANAMTDLFCHEGLVRVARSLRTAYEEGGNGAAREDMALASLYGGLALANAGLGAVHGFAAPIGGMFPAPHGAVCACLLPLVMEANVTALQAREPQSPALRRYGEIAQMLTGQSGATAGDGVAWVQALCRELHVPPLAAHGVTAAAFPELVEKAAAASSMQANPLPLTPQEMQSILSNAL